MLNRDGNPTARNLGVIVRSIAEDLGIKPRVQVAACRQQSVAAHGHYKGLATKKEAKWWFTLKPTKPAATIIALLDCFRGCVLEAIYE